MQLLALQHRREMAIMQQKHEAQLKALEHQESYKQLHNGDASLTMENYPEMVSTLQDKLITINESLSILFATLQTIATVVPPGDARKALITLADMGSPLLAISGDLHGLSHG